MKLINKYKEKIILEEFGEYFLKLDKEIKIIIDSKEDIKLILLSENYDKKVEIYINSNISVDIYELSINSNSKKYIYQNKENSKVNYYHGNINKTKSDIYYNVVVNEENTENNLYIHSLLHNFSWGFFHFLTFLIKKWSVNRATIISEI